MFYSYGIPNILRQKTEDDMLNITEREREEIKYFILQIASNAVDKNSKANCIY